MEDEKVTVDEVVQPSTVEETLQDSTVVEDNTLQDSTIEAEAPNSDE